LPNDRVDLWSEFDKILSISSGIKKEIPKTWAGLLRPSFVCLSHLSYLGISSIEDGG
jgi:pullulanase/glycogen debranching enzyme